MIHPNAHSFWHRKQVTGIPEAPKSRRFLNLLIDYAVAYAVILLIFNVVSYIYIYTNWIDADISGLLFGDDYLDEALRGIAVSLLHFATYFIIEAATKGRTVGKLITKTFVVQLDDRPITIKQAFIRSIVRLIPFEAFTAIYTEPWHDRLSKTKVVMKKRG